MVGLQDLDYNACADLLDFAGKQGTKGRQRQCNAEQSPTSKVK